MPSFAQTFSDCLHTGIDYMNNKADSCSSIVSFMCMSCRSFFVRLSYFLCSLCCLSVDLRILITPLVSSNSSYKKHELLTLCAHICSSAVVWWSPFCWSILFSFLFSLSSFYALRLITHVFLDCLFLIATSVFGFIFKVNIL